MAVWLASGGVENCPTKTAVDAEIAESSGPSPDVAAEAVDVVQDSTVYPPASELTEPLDHQQFSTADEAAGSSGPLPDVTAETAVDAFVNDSAIVPSVSEVSDVAGQLFLTIDEVVTDMATERGVDQVASMDSSIYSEPVFRSPVQPYESCLFDHDYTNVGVDNTVDIMNSSPDSGSGQSAFGRAFSSSTRKRLRSPNDWKRNKDKLARQKGQKYTNCGGVTVPTKQPPVGIQLCTRKCRLRCDEIHDDERLRIFTEFYNLDENGKNIHIFSCIQSYKPKVMHLSARRHRAASFSYYTVVNGVRRQICKKAFSSLHMVTPGKLRHICEQVMSGQSTAHPDMRGRHSTRVNRASEQAKETVRDHIRSFPAEPSHYSRHKNGNRLYLSAFLSVGKMYDEYVKLCSDKGENPMSSSAYRDIFTKEFNFGFGCPKSDTCSTCDKAANASNSDALEDHKHRADLAFRAMQADREEAQTTNSSKHFITFDLQKTLPLPKLTTSVAFYLRQVWLYNCGIHVASSAASGSYFHLWTENEAGRGCNEICSCILAFLDKTGMHGGHLTAWSDSCAGQNKNFFTVCLWQLLIQQGRFSIIDHKFPEPGHSFLDSDRDFAHIEKSVRKKGNIYTKDQYADTITASFRKSKTGLTHMNGKFYDLKQLPRALGIRNTTNNTDGERICFRDNIRWVRVEKFGEYSYKNSISDSAPWHHVQLTASDSTSQCDLNALLLPECTKPVSDKKLCDIKKLLPFIPAVYQEFYHKLTSSASEQAEDDTLIIDTENAGNKLCIFCL